MRADEVDRSRRRRTSRGPRARARRRRPPRRRPRAPRPPATSLRSTSASRRLAGLEVDRAERLHQRRQRLHRRADDDRLAVRDAGLDPAGAVRLAVEPLVGSISSCASEPRTRGEREAVADLDALDRLDAHQRGGEPRVEPVVLRRVRAEPRRNAARATTSTIAAERVAILRGVGRLSQPSSPSAPPISSDRAGDRRSRSPRAAPSRPRRRRRCTAVWRALARSSALRTSSMPVLERRRRGRRGPGRGSVTGFVPLPGGSPSGGHGLIPHVPVRVVAVADDERERRAERAPVAEAGEHLDARPSRAAGAGCGRSPAGGARRSASIASRSSTSPAGRPVTIATSAGPCDSPAVASSKRHGASLRRPASPRPAPARPSRARTTPRPARRAPRGR